MRYITVSEAAARWGISERLVQRYCTQGRIPGAAKFSGRWAIPADAAKPDDPRRAASPLRESGPILQPMPLMNTAFAPGTALETARAVEDPDLREIALAEYCYFTGQAEKATVLATPLLEHTEPAVRLSACLIVGYASLTLGQIHHARDALARMQQVPLETLSPALQAAAVFILNTAAVLLHLPTPVDAGDLSQALRHLPPGLRQFALYIQAHRAYLEGEHARSLGIVETAFAIEPGTYPIPAFYLHLIAVMDAMSLKRPELAERHLLAAWDLARPDDLIEAFGEHHGLLGGMLEAVIKPQWPDDFKRIIDITYRFSAGWRRVHNPDTGHAVADNLSTTEFAICMLAARSWTNQEIAAHLGLSIHTVKQYISNALSKLGVKQRKDLKQFMLL